MIDPYQLLPAIFAEADDQELDRVISDPQLSDGGAAMVAYARMQFSEMAGRSAAPSGRPCSSTASWTHWPWSCCGSTGTKR